MQEPRRSLRKMKGFRASAKSVTDEGAPVASNERDALSKMFLRFINYECVAAGEYRVLAGTYLFIRASPRVERADLRRTVHRPA